LGFSGTERGAPAPPNRLVRPEVRPGGYERHGAVNISTIRHLGRRVLPDGRGRDPTGCSQ